MLHQLSNFYAQTLIKAIDGGAIQCDMLFGPAYKGIALASSLAIRMAELGRDIPFAYNRKESKDHGEGGNVIGAPIQGKVVIVDDVISAGTSIRESVDIIKEHGGQPAAVLIALDRQERAGNAEDILPISAVQEVEERYKIPVISIATFDDLMNFLRESDNQDLKAFEKPIAAYRAKYGVEKPLEP